MGTISHVKVVSFEYEAGPLQKDKWGPTESACVVTLTTEDGATGTAVARAEAGTSSRTLSEFLTKRLAPMLVGRSADEHRELWADMVRMYQAQHITVFALSVADVALWDLRGVLAGRSVAALLSETPAAYVPAYSSIPRIQDPHAAADAAAAVLTQGFTAVKLHSRWGVADYDHELAICRTVRESLPADIDLMYDASRALDRHQALHLGSGLEELGYAWLEEPFGPYDASSARWLRDRVGIAVAGFETAPGAHLATQWALEHGGFDLVEVDCFWKGGLTGAWEVSRRAKEIGHGLCMHHGGSPSMNLANLHLAAAADNLDMIELLVPMDQYNRSGPVPGPDAGLGVPVPTAPGLGGELDWAFIDAHTVDDFVLTAS